MSRKHKKVHGRTKPKKFCDPGVCDCYQYSGGIAGRVGRFGKYLRVTGCNIPNTFVIGTILTGLKSPSKSDDFEGDFVPKLVSKSMSL